MVKYTCKRLLLIIPVILAVTALIFLLLSLVPGDPAKLILGNEATVEMLAEKRDQLGLDDPLIIRMLRYMKEVFFHLDFGTSYYNTTPIFSEILSRLPRTITIAGFGVLLTTLLGIPLGVMAAVKQNGLIDRLCMVLSMVGVKAGSLFGAKYKSKAELAGGVILILMGLKILLEHLGIIG